MLNIKFYSEKNKKSVMVSLTCFGKRIRFSSKIQLDKQTFFKICPKGMLNPKYSHKPEFKILKALQDFIFETYNKALNERKVLSETEFKAKIKDFLEPKETEKPQTPTCYFWSKFDEFLDAQKRANLTARTLNNYTNLRKHLIEFSNKTKFEVAFENINKKFIDEFRLYFLNLDSKAPNQKTQIGFSNDTTDKYLRNFKTFLVWAFDRNFHENTAFKFIKTQRAKNINKPILRPSEFEKILQVDTSNNKTLDLAKDILTILVFSGQRISDVLRFNANDIKNLNEKPVWHILQSKTKVEVAIPLYLDFFKPLLLVFQKYNFRLPYFYEQKINKALKELARLAGLNEPFKVQTEVGNKVITQEKPFYELISTHIGRRTFITYALSNGVPENVVRLISGHKKLETLQKYDKADFYEMFNAFSKLKTFVDIS